MIRTCVLAWVGVVVSVALPTAHGVAEDTSPASVSPTDVLGGYCRYLNSIRSSKMALTARTFLLNGSGDRVLAETEKKDIVVDQIHRRMYIATETRLVSDGSEAMVSNREERTVADGLLVDLVETTDQRGVAVAVSTDAIASEVEWRKCLSSSYFSIVYGCLPLPSGDCYLPDLMEKMEATVRQTSEDGRNFVTWCGHSSALDLEVQCDAGNQFAPVRITYQILQPRDPGGVAAYTFAASEFSESQTYRFPTRYEIVTTHPGGVIPGSTKKLRFRTSQDGKDVVLPRRVIIRQVVVDRVEVNLTLAANDFALKTPIAEGTPVFCRNSPNLAFAWRDGKVVPDIDENAEVLARDAQFLGGPGSPRFWLVLANVIVAFSILVIVWIRRRQAGCHK